MTKKRKIILATVAFSILLAIGVSLTYIFCCGIAAKAREGAIIKSGAGVL